MLRTLGAQGIMVEQDVEWNLRLPAVHHEGRKSLEELDFTLPGLLVTPPQRPDVRHALGLVLQPALVKKLHEHPQQEGVRELLRERPVRRDEILKTELRPIQLGRMTSIAVPSRLDFFAIQGRQTQSVSGEGMVALTLLGHVHEVTAMVVHLWQVLRRGNPPRQDELDPLPRRLVQEVQHAVEQRLRVGMLVDAVDQDHPRLFCRPVEDAERLRLPILLEVEHGGQGRLEIRGLEVHSPQQDDRQSELPILPGHFSQQIRLATSGIGRDDHERSPGCRPSTKYRFRVHPGLIEIGDDLLLPV